MRITLVSLVLLALHPPSSEAGILDRLRKCILRRTSKYVNKTMVQDGRVLRCEGFVKYNICYGQCETSEIGDYMIPYKISWHRVCTYKKYDPVELTPPWCHRDHPDPGVLIYNATACACDKCNTTTTSCE